MAEPGKNEFKDTVNLPRTDFDMRAGLLAKEPAMQQAWREAGLYRRIREARRGAPRFVLHDGPPYANGNIHMGTALNKVLKDVVVRVATMTGHDSPYVPGWDCHGLPIEHRVLQELGPKAVDLTPLQIRERCRDYAQGFVELHAAQFQRLGVLGEFDDPYLTMSPAYEAATLEVFARLVEQGLVTRELKPVHWSVDNRTALAEAELEYRDRDDPSVYVLFDVVEGADALPGPAGERKALLVWTTTPWTLPANRATAVHPEYVYAAVRAAGPGGPVTFVVAEELREAVLAAVTAEAGALGDAETVGTLTGRELLDAGIEYAHPVEAGRLCSVVEADYVTLDQGTGLVHTAPGHGAEDFATGKRFGLEIYCPVRGDGTYDDTVPEGLRGLSVWDANPRVVEALRASGHLAREETIHHSYPHDWRSKGPTIFRATEQWFVSVERGRKADGTSLREAALAVTGETAAGGGVDFVPGWGRARMRGMLEARPDWCVSRQRFWGLPIPVFYDADERPLLTPASVRAVARVVAAEGADAWYEHDPSTLLRHYEPAKDPHHPDREGFASAELVKGNDIFDVWFESGSSWFAVAVERGLVEGIPVDVYLEGSDQHRGWFQLSLLTALGLEGKAPFREVVTHGFIVDENGHKMSKSVGNTIDAMEQLEKRGADVLRLWLASQDFAGDVRCSEAMIGQAEDTYRKIRNTLRFLMGGCHDFDPARDAVDPEAGSLDAWFRRVTQRLVRDVRRAYDAYEFHKGVRALTSFCIVEASAIYLSAVKDRLYCDAPDSPRRRAAQTVMHEALVSLVKLLAPVIPHTAEEAWNHVPARSAEEPDTVHLALLPEADSAQVNAADAATEGSLDEYDPTRGAAWTWARLLELRDDGLRQLEAIRNAGVKKPLDTEAVLRVAPGHPAAGLLAARREDLEDLLGVGYLRVEEGTDGVSLSIEDARERYGRCERSWKRRPDVGSDPGYPTLSARDAAAVRVIRGEGDAS